jgi:hypothetical protein
MAKKNKLEQVLEYLVAGDEARAKDLLHQVFIDKARAIHEELISADEDMDEETLGGDEGKQLRHDMMHHSDHIDELSDEIDSEEIMGEDEDMLDADADMDMADAEDDLGDAMSDVDDAEMDDEDAMSDDVMGDIESTMGDLETALADLKAEFEKLEGGSDDADMGDDMSDDMSDDMGDDMGDEEGEEEMDEMFTEEDFDDLAEAVELEKVAVPTSGEVGAGKFSPRDSNENSKSPVPPTQTSRFGAKPIKTGDGPKADGYARQPAPTSAKLPIEAKGNQRKKATDGMENEQSGRYGAKEDSRSALDTTDRTFGKGNQTSPLTHAPRK